MKDFIDIVDLDAGQIQELLDMAVALKKEHFNGGNKPLFKGKTLAMIFQKPSLRTRVSFDMAMRQMDGDALYLSPAEIGLGKREAIGDVAQVLSGYVDVLMARVFQHENVVELAKYADVPVINGLSDNSHPCQAMADALTIQEKFGTLKDLTISFIGDGNNVAVSLMQVSLMLGANFKIAAPLGYKFPESVFIQATELSNKYGGKFEQFEDPFDGVKGAQVVYTDTWTSMGQEDEASIREKIFASYQVNRELISKADSDCIVMHCLPAHRNHELTDDIADGPHSVIFQQAHNRLHAQKAILARLLKVI